MASEELAWEEITTAAKAAQTAWNALPGNYPMVMETQNRAIVNFVTQKKPYVTLEIIFLDGNQLNLGQPVQAAQYGQIHLTACGPDNEGSKEQLKIIGFFRPYLELKIWSVVQTHVAATHKNFDRKGWDCWPMIVPFWFHRTVASA